MKIYIYIIAIIGLLVASCKKGFLDASPNKSLAIPESLEDFQALMDYNNIINYNPCLAEVCSDNYYVPTSYLKAQQYYGQNCYVWDSNTYAGGSGTQLPDWNYAYSNIYIENVVISGLGSFHIDPAQQTIWNSIMGMALFYRAVEYYELAQEFAPPYNPNSANSDLGLPLRLTADLDQPTSRAKVKDTYDQMIKDLLKAETLLSQTVPSRSLNRPSKAANAAMLARVYLSMQDYNDALKYADTSLSYYNTLMDFNTLNPHIRPPYPSPNPEALVQILEIAIGLTSTSSTSRVVDSTLYNSYDSNDLRKVVFFTINSATGLPYYHSSYSNLSSFFNGTAVDEEYLVRAECYARMGNVARAMQDLNGLLVTRYKTGTFVPRTAMVQTDALSQILFERRKELCFRAGLRWTDLRRLNQDPKYAVTLTRLVAGNTYTLPPNDKRYTLLIPLDEIQLSGIQQNPR